MATTVPVSGTGLLIKTQVSAARLPRDRSRGRHSRFQRSVTFIPRWSRPSPTIRCSSRGCRRRWQLAGDYLTLQAKRREAQEAEDR